MSFNCPKCNDILEVEKLTEFQSGDEITMQVQLADEVSILSAETVCGLISSYRQTNIAIAKVLGFDTEVFITKLNMQKGLLQITFKQELLPPKSELSDKEDK